MLDPDFYEDDAPRIIAAARAAGRRAGEARLRRMIEAIIGYPRRSFCGKKLVDEAVKAHGDRSNGTSQ